MSFASVFENDTISEIENFYYKQISKDIINKNITNVFIISKNRRLTSNINNILVDKNYKVHTFKNVESSSLILRTFKEKMLFIFDNNLLRSLQEELIIHLKDSVKICLIDHTLYPITDKLVNYCDYIINPIHIKSSIFPSCKIEREILLADSMQKNVKIKLKPIRQKRRNSFPSKSFSSFIS